MAASNSVLRIAQDEDKQLFILLHLKSIGAKALDLKLVGTEGEAPYVATIKHDKAVALKAKNATISDDEWLAILQNIFSQLPTPDIHATAAVQSESTVTITIRKQVQGISQRLGAIMLNYEPEEAIELFEWCGNTAEKVSTTKAEASEATTKLTELENVVDDLKRQLRELIQAKETDEAIMLQKFRDVLNEKKAKIREQLTIMADGTLKPGPPPTIPEQTEETTVSSSAEPKKSRPAKRKAPTRAGIRTRRATTKEVESEDEEQESAAIPAIKSEPQDSDDDGNTTERTASTASGDEDEEMKDGVPLATIPEPQPVETAKKTPSAPPPKRELPFINRKTTAPPKTAAEDTDSDDEL
ncbi:hypothetical protein VHEMI05527 [[Torrubiella] hemipterigena]|uniref:XRCC4 coiled-coil domain-containing protein n=1 Tax=[Torrubiella] hemipterigena TaxID=1531966 RepID=A0A0A1TJ19_9HYPO|nr:hypothetical protein VHEMI05527 [[Torrubiella] hemipterigena]